MSSLGEKLEASIFAARCREAGASPRMTSTALVRARGQRETVQALLEALARRARFRRFTKELISFARFCRQAGCDATARHLCELARADRRQAYYASLEARAHVAALERGWQ